MLQSGRNEFGQMETVRFGTAAAETLAEEAERLDANRVFLMVSGTLNRETDEIERCGARWATAAPVPSIACRRTRPGAR